MGLWIELSTVQDSPSTGLAEMKTGNRMAEAQCVVFGCCELKRVRQAHCKEHHGYSRPLARLIKEHDKRHKSALADFYGQI